MTSDLSALMDGELDPDEEARLLARLEQEIRLRETWAAYHVIGDALRRAGPLSLDVRARVADRIALEPTLLAPRSVPRRPPRTPMIALAASVAALALLGVLAWQRQGGGTASLELAARAPMTTVSAAKPASATAAGTKTASPGVGDVYVLAHQDLSPGFLLAGMPVYVRAVAQTDEGR